MPDHDRVLQVVREWVIKAENDLKNAAHTLKMGADCPTDTVCFHAQQCVEKYMKAVLVMSGIFFLKPMTSKRWLPSFRQNIVHPSMRMSRLA